MDSFEEESYNKVMLETVQVLTSSDFSMTNTHLLASTGSSAYILAQIPQSTFHNLYNVLFQQISDTLKLQTFTV